MENADNRDIAGFVLELQEYVRDGVTIWMDGKNCSPVKAAQECLLREEACYMRDYICDERNRVVQIRFDRVDPLPKDCLSLYKEKES